MGISVNRDREDYEEVKESGERKQGAGNRVGKGFQGSQAVPKSAAGARPLKAGQHQTHWGHARCQPRQLPRPGEDWASPSASATIASREYGTNRARQQGAGGQTTSLAGIFDITDGTLEMGLLTGPGLRAVVV
jgi:hypothetical protein